MPARARRPLYGDWPGHLGKRWRAMARVAFGLTPLGIAPALLCVRAQRGLSLRERGQLSAFPRRSG
jgi:hypothetical protein